MDIADPERPEEAPRHLHDLRVQRRRSLADAFDAHLGELVLPAGLRPFRPEEGAGVLHAHGPDLLVEMRAEDRPQVHPPCPPAGASRSVRRDPRSVNICFSTMSVSVPTPRLKSSVASMIGVSIERYPNELRDRLMGVEQPSTSAELIGKDVSRAPWALRSQALASECTV